ncbi:MAG: ImmA/IrrE family metallo-endopeptidase [Sphingomonadaceae bacterium]|nr:ImmA/IrrE family metallo-endopeptidase [Sphingomonadaceae bacterium]
MKTVFQTPVPTNWSEEQIGGVAEEVARKLGYKPGSDITAFVKRELGGTVDVDDWREPAPTGEIQVRGPGDFTIWLSPYTAPARDTFTIAHELGHYFLHSKIGKRPIEVKREGNNRLEWEANCFAAAFLLPAEEFTQAWGKYNGNIGIVAAKFGVSTSVVSIRAERLELPK